MKKVLTFLLLIIAVDALAYHPKRKDDDPATSVYVSYSPMKFHTILPTKTDVYPQLTHSISAGANYRLIFARHAFLETGLGLNFTMQRDPQSDSGIGYTEDIRNAMFAFKIPLQLGYAFHLPLRAFTIEPYAGAYGRLNIFGNRKITTTQGNHVSTNKSDLLQAYGEGADKIDAFKRFVAGYQVGARVSIHSRFFVAGEFVSDFTNNHDSQYKSIFRGGNFTVGMYF